MKRNEIVTRIWGEAVWLQRFSTTDMLNCLPDVPASSIRRALTLMRRKGTLAKTGKGPWRLRVK